jgi:hypothetical protein
VIPDSALLTARQKGLAGLLTLSESLLAAYTAIPESLDPKLLLTLIAFSSQDPWTTPTSRNLSTEILSNYNHQTLTSSFINNYILQQVIRPIFSLAKRPSTITPSGRKAMPTSAPPRRYDASDLDPVNLPWIYEKPYTITVFEWAVVNSTVRIFSPKPRCPLS